MVLIPIAVIISILIATVTVYRTVVGTHIFVIVILLVTVVMVTLIMLLPCGTNFPAQHCQLCYIASSEVVSLAWTSSSSCNVGGFCCGPEACNLGRLLLTILFRARINNFTVYKAM